MSNTNWSQIVSKSSSKLIHIAQKPTCLKYQHKRTSERLMHLTKLLDRQHKIYTLLDIGCGNAELTIEIAKEYKVSQIYGADIYTHDKFIKADQVIYKQVIDNQLDIKDNSVDLITCFMSIHHFVNFEAMMNEICRVMKPNGYLFIREHDVPENDIDLKLFLDRKHLEYPDHFTSEIINYWDRQKLKLCLQSKYKFKHLGDADYPTNCKNPQAIYHSIYKLIK